MSFILFDNLNRNIFEVYKYRDKRENKKTSMHLLNRLRRKRMDETNKKR